jgi:hypothetical protein
LSSNITKKNLHATKKTNLKELVQENTNEMQRITREYFANLYSKLENIEKMAKFLALYYLTN